MLHTLIITATLTIAFCTAMVALLRTGSVASIALSRTLFSASLLVLGATGAWVVSKKVRKTLKNTLYLSLQSLYTLGKILINILRMGGNIVGAFVLTAGYWLFFLGKHGSILFIGLGLQLIILSILALIKSISGIWGLAFKVQQGLLKDLRLVEKALKASIKNFHKIPSFSKLFYKKVKIGSKKKYHHYHRAKQQKPHQHAHKENDKNTLKQQSKMLHTMGLKQGLRGIRIFFETLKDLVIIAVLLIKALWNVGLWISRPAQLKRAIKIAMDALKKISKEVVNITLIMLMLSAQIVWGLAKLIGRVLAQAPKVVKSIYKHWKVSIVTVTMAGVVLYAGKMAAGTFVNHFSADEKGFVKYMQSIKNIVGNQKPILAKRRYEVVINVPERTRIETMLKEESIEAEEINAVLESLRKIKRDTVVGNAYVRMELENNSGSIGLIKMTIPTGITTDIIVEKKGDGVFYSKVEEKEVRKYTHRRVAKIESNLSQAALGSGIPQTVITNLTNLFAWDIDFQRDIRAGDSVEVLFECEYTLDDDLAACGTILYAALVVQGRNFKVYAYPYEGEIKYFSPEGASIEKSLLKTPVEGAKLTSGYGPRTHPVLGYTKQHKGVDFGAPVGTRVFAAGDGIITRLERSGTYGNIIVIKHKNDYSTFYAHLNGFATGLKVGARVRRQQLIAYTGATGLATGPHLHYEVRIKDSPVNPMTLKFNAEFSLTSTELLEYQGWRTSVDTLFSRTPTKGKVLTDNTSLKINSTKTAAKE